MTETTQQVIVAFAALAALAYLGRGVFALFRPPARSTACDHCAVATIVEDATAPQDTRGADHASPASHTSQA